MRLFYEVRNVRWQCRLQCFGLIKIQSGSALKSLENLCKIINYTWKETLLAHSFGVVSVDGRDTLEGIAFWVN